MAHHDGQAQLQGTLNLPLFASDDIGSDCLDSVGSLGTVDSRIGGLIPGQDRPCAAPVVSTFHGFGRHLETSQQFHLPSPLVEWRF